MRVLMTADTVGGVWTYALELCRALAGDGVEVALATMGAPLSPSQRAEAAALSNVGIFESRYKLEWMDDPWVDVDRAGAWLEDLEQRLEPDVIHLNGYVHGRQSWRAPVLMVAHSCVLSWWQAVKHEPAPPTWRPYHDAVREGIHRADLVVAPTAAMLQCVVDHYGAPRRTRVISNARDARQFSPGAKEPMILSAGRMWDPAKNLSVLRQVAPSLRWKTCVAGDAGNGSSGPEHAAVHMLGHLDSTRMAAWMGRAAIYALPARYEPFGLSALEAALSGCALVLGDIPSLREVWGNAATYVDPDDADGLCRMLNRLSANRRARVALASAARERAASYAPRTMSRAYLGAYRELIDRQNGLHATAPVHYAPMPGDDLSAAFRLACIG